VHDHAAEPRRIGSAFARTAKIGGRGWISSRPSHPPIAERQRRRRTLGTGERERDRGREGEREREEERERADPSDGQAGSARTIGEHLRAGSGRDVPVKSQVFVG